VASHSAAPDDEGDSYFVSGPSNDHVVEVWSASRIPFDPKGKMRDLREQIRSAIRRFRPSTPSLCYGLYVSPDRSFCDAENVLFYNVDGVGVFSGLFRLGVCFERAFADTPAPKEPLGFEPRHYHRYQLVSDAVWRYWRATATIGSSTALLPRGELSVHRVWWQLQQGRVQPVDDIEGAPHQFGLRMTTRNIALQSTATLKRLVDGVVAAFQAHDESQLHVCSSRLAALIGQDERAVSRALVDARNACLGVRRLLWPRSTGVQWNPADDQCVAATITVLPHNGAEEPQISAEVVAVSETASDASLARA
jgi:hypothetical protein